MNRGSDQIKTRYGAFHDWIGTSALQEDIGHGPRLEALAGLDRNEWIAVGITIVPACGNDADDDIYRYVVNMPALGIDTRWGGFQELKAYAHRHGALPVTRILLRDVGLPQLMSHMTAATFHLRAVRVHDTTLDVIKEISHHQ
jgi:hypothetical protein